MNIYEQDKSVPVIANVAVNNTEERTPCILLIDCSYSMTGVPIQQVNSGLQQFERAIKADAATAARVVVSVVAFGIDDEKKPVQQIQDWVEADQFTAPRLAASGMTPMGQAMDMALGEIERVKHTLRQNGITYKRPWIFLMTDGEPTDDGWEQAADRCAKAVEEKRIVLWALTTDPESAENLGRFVGPGGNVYNIEEAEANLSEMFVWLSSSLASASGPGAGTTLQLMAPPGSRIITIET